MSSDARLFIFDHLLPLLSLAVIAFVWCIGWRYLVSHLRLKQSRHIATVYWFGTGAAKLVRAQRLKCG